MSSGNYPVNFFALRSALPALEWGISPHAKEKLYRNIREIAKGEGCTDSGDSFFHGKMAELRDDLQILAASLYSEMQFQDVGQVLVTEQLFWRLLKGKDYSPFYTVAYVLAAQGHFLKALQAAERRGDIVEYPTDVDLWKLRLTLKEKLEVPEEQMDLLFSQAISAFEEKGFQDAIAELYLHRGDYCVRMGRKGDIEVSYVTAFFRATDPKLRQKIFEQHLRALEPEFHRAFIDSNRASAVDVTSPLALLDVAKCYESIGLDVESFIHINQSLAAVVKNKNDSEGQKCTLALIHFYLRRGNIESARSLCMDALLKFPKNELLWQIHIQMNYQIFDSPMINALFQHALKHLPHSAVLECEYARYLTNTGDITGAFEHLAKAVEFDPTYGDAHLERLRLALLHSDQAAAQATYQSCLHFMPSHGFMWQFFQSEILTSIPEIFERATHFFLGAQVESYFMATTPHCLYPKYDADPYFRTLFSSNLYEPKS